MGCCEEIAAEKRSDMRVKKWGRAKAHIGAAGTDTRSVVIWTHDGQHPAAGHDGEQARERGEVRGSSSMAGTRARI
jgi:hypothetical protein